MSRYIDADSIEQYMNREEWKTPDEKWWPEREIGMIIDAIPTADVKPVVRGENLGGGAFLCSACGFDDVAHSHTVKFCPNCGAEIINARSADEDDSGLRR